MTDAIIIGAGIAGLSAALRLTQAGRSVVLLDPGPAGGLIATSHVDGFLLEHGPNVLLDRPDLHLLLQDLDLLDQRVFPRVEKYAQSVWYGGRAVDVPRSLTAMAATPLFPVSVKALLLPRLLLPGRLRPRAEDESIAALLSRVIGSAGVERVLQPGVQGIFGGDVGKLSARSLLPELWADASAGKALFNYRRRAAKRRRVFVLRGGMGSLTRALVERLPAGTLKEEAASRARYLPEDRLFAIETAAGGELRARALLVTTAGAATAAYLGGLDAGLAEELARLRFAPLVVAHIGVAGADAAKIRHDAFGVLFPPGAAGGILGIMFNSALFPHVAPHGTHLLTVCLGGISAPELIEASEAALLGTIRTELRAKLGINEPRLLALHRWPRAIPQIEVGHFKLLARMREVEARLPGLKFAGTDTGGVGVPERVRAAAETAASLLEFA